MTRPGSARFLVATGVVTWVAAGLPQIARWASGRAPFGSASLAWCAAFGAFALAFAVATARRRRPWSAAALAAQSVAAIVALALGRTRFESALLCVVAGEAPLLVGERTAFVYVIAQTAGMFAVEVAGRRGALFAPLAYTAFQLFAFGAARLAAREASARAELARVHAELLATRELFADGARAAERLRISRELHDALGHHLTALSLQLEIARHVAPDAVAEPVERARELATDALSELRSVVSSMRSDAPPDLGHAIRTLVAGIPHPRVHLDVQESLEVDAALAHTIFRCAQEALTNAVRHAGAQNVYLTIASRDGTVAVTARDDGQGAGDVREGHGLAGLRERIEGMGGTFEVVARRGSGLTLRALLPARTA